MRSLSAEFRRKIYDDEADYQVRAVIYITSNLRLDLDNSNIWTGGFSFEECVSEDDNFTAIGSVIMGSATLIINNIYDTYSQYDFTNVKVELYIGMQLSNRLEELQIGTYIVDNAVYNGATITLTLVDYISKFDQPFYLTSLSYPATLLEIVQNLCTVCGVTLNTLNFPHNGYSINYEPEKEAVSCREVLSWVATIAGCYVKCNASGQLVLQWFNTNALENFASELDGGTFNPWSAGDVYDGGTFNPWSAGDVYDGGPIVVNNTVHYISDLYTQSIAMDDVVITGVSIEVKNTDDSQTQELLEFKTGTAGYVIQLSENPFINSQNAQIIINWLGTQLIGLRFRKLNVSIAGDLAIESGDVGIVTDARQSIYRILITRVTFSVGGAQSIICGASTPARNSAVRFSNNTKNYVELRKQLKQQKTTYDQALDDLADAMNAKSGLYSTIEIAQSGNIYYLHDKPTLADSKVVWKMNSEAIAVTTDYKGSNPSQTVWNFGVQINGDVVARILTARGINADWINAGAISIKNANNVETFYANTATGVVRINATSFQLTDGTTISSAAEAAANAAASGAIRDLTQQQIFNKLTNNSQNEGVYLADGRIYINASMIKAGYISFDRAQGGTLKLGGNNNGNGELQLYNSSNSLIGGMDNTGIVTQGPVNGASSYTQKVKINTDGLQLYENDVKLMYMFVQRDGTHRRVAIGSPYSTGSSDTLADLNVGYTVHSATTQYTNSGVVKDYDGNSRLPYRVYSSHPIRSDYGIIVPLSNSRSFIYSAYIYNLRAHKLTVDSDGSKSKIVKTKNYSDRLLYCYETASPMFGDIGEGVIGEDGYCYITIDPIFSSTIVTNQYQVFLQKYDDGDCYVAERKSAYFVVRGTPNLSFAWELKSKQLGFTQTRLDINEPSVNIENEVDYADMAQKHIQQIYEERMYRDESSNVSDGV